MSDFVDHRRANTVAIRQACVEAHWLPQMRLRFAQPGQDDTYIGQHGMADSCLFRKMVADWLEGTDTSPLADFDLDRPLSLLRSMDRGNIGIDTGLISMPFGAQHTVVAFSTILGEPGEFPPAPARRFELDGISIVEAVDPELGVALLHTSHESDDAEEASHAQLVMHELAIDLAIGSVETNLLIGDSN